MSDVKQHKFKMMKHKIIKEDQEIIFKNISLNLAIKFGKIKTVKSLLQKGIDINKPGKNGLTPLHVAVKHNRLKILKFLIQNGALLDSLSAGAKSQKITPLLQAVKDDRLNAAKILLESGANISTKIDGIYNPIYYAVFKGNKEMVELFLDYGADINLRFDNNFFEENEPTFYRSLWKDHNLTLLHYSILNKNRELRELLLDRGADINLKTSLGKTTLMQAVEISNGVLVNHFAEIENVNDCDIYGQPVLHFVVLNANSKASMYSKEENIYAGSKLMIVQTLLSAGADLYARFPKDQEYSTVIHYMIKYGFKQGVSNLLYSYDIDFNFNIIDLRSVNLGRLATENLTPDIENDLDYINNLKQRFEDITYVIVMKAMIFKMAGLPVDENLLLKHPIHDWITPEEHTANINSRRDLIIKQIDFMKGIKICNTNFTVWHLVSCKINELINLMPIEAIRYFDCKKIDFKSISYYYKILEKRLSYAEDRKFLLANSIESIANLFIHHLPYDCCVKIINCLNNEDLKLMLNTK